MVEKSIIVVFTTLFIRISLLDGTQIVKVAEANPYWIYKTIDPLPGATSPIVKIFSPQNNTVYYSDNVTVDFKVFRPTITGVPLISGRSRSSTAV
jgi:hypothetical protein